MVKAIVCDTSTIITLFSAYHLSTNKYKYLEGLKKYELIAPDSVHMELKEFTRFQTAGRIYLYAIFLL